MTIISQNLFRRHRGTRGESTEEHETARNDSSNNNQESTSNDNVEATLASSSTNNNVITTSLNRNDVENPLNENNTSINEEEEEENDDEVQELVIRIPSNNIHSNNTNNNEPSIQFPNWTLNEEEINNRREAIRTEIEHMQQSNFIHFAVLCLVPTSLLLIVITAILSEDGECSGDGLTVCEREPRTFVNAFTTRCICDAVMGSVVLMMKNGDEDGSNP